MWAPDSATSGHLCLFTCGTRRFALPVAALEGMIEPGPLVRLPLAPARVLGLCSHRRQVLPVFRFDEEGAAGGPLAVLLVRTDQGNWGIRADRQGVALIDGRVVSGGVEGPGATGTVLHEGRTHTYIDPERAWQALRGEVEREYASARGRAESVDTTSVHESPEETKRGPHDDTH